MQLAELNQRLVEVFGRDPSVTLHREKLVYRAGEFEFLKARSREIGPGDKVVLVAAGVHGDERSGPLTLAHLGSEIIENTHCLGLKLIVYPLRNPSGYHAGLRYNADHDMGEEGNNDFLRYVLGDGRLSSSIVPTPRQTPQFRWSSDPELGVHLALETRVMHRLLREDPLEQVVAAIDLHQDLLTPQVGAGAYHYAFESPQYYESIVARIEVVCPLLVDRTIGAGFGTRIDEHGEVVGEPSEEHAMRSDDRAFIRRHDGTLSDLLYRLGVRHSIAAETTGATPMPSAIEVNRLWIEGLLEIATATTR